MDVDTFIAQHAGEWQRLDDLAGRRGLDGAEADEVVALYRQVATHLSVVQTRAPDPALEARLSALLSRGRGAAVGTPRVRGWAAFVRGVTVDFPVIVYRTWRWSVATAFVNIAVAAAMWLWLRRHPDRITRVLPGNEVHKLVDQRVRELLLRPSGPGVRGPGVDEQRARGRAGAVPRRDRGGHALHPAAEHRQPRPGRWGLIASHRSGLFFGLILPHGMLELTAVFVSAAIGLRTGWAWIAPGDLPRSRSLAQAGRSAAVVAVGMVGVLLVSGVIEAFVTPSGLPTWARIGIGALAELAFITYVVVLGRRACGPARRRHPRPRGRPGRGVSRRQGSSSTSGISRVVRFW